MDLSPRPAAERAVLHPLLSTRRGWHDVKRHDVRQRVHELYTSSGSLWDVLGLLGRQIKSYAVFLVVPGHAAQTLPDVDWLILPARTERIAVWHAHGPEAAQTWAYEFAAHAGRLWPCVDVADAFGPVRWRAVRAGDGTPIGILGVVSAGPVPPGMLRAFANALGTLATQASTAPPRHERAALEHAGSLPVPMLITVRGRIAFANEAAALLLGASDGAALHGFAPFDFISAEQAPLLDPYMTPLSEHEGGREELELIRLDGAVRFVEWHSSATTYGGEPAVQIVLQDVTLRRSMEARYRTFVSTITEGVWGMTVTQPLSIHATPQTQAATILEQAVFSECNATMARLLEAASPERVLGRPLHTLRGLDLRLVERFVALGYRLRGREVWVRRDGQMRHFLVNAVGIVEQDRLVGIWGSCVDITSRISLEREVIEAQEDQLKRVGRYLHDNTGQLLTGIRLLSSHLATGADAASVQALAERIAALADEATTSLRDIYRGLIPSRLKQEGLRAALARLADQVDAVPGVEGRFEQQSAGPELGAVVDEKLDEEAALQLYRIAQEATNNALKYAQAQTITIWLGRVDGRLELHVEDDGQGFDLVAQESESLGLKNMAARARMIHCDLDIQTAPGAGTLVRCRCCALEDHDAGWANGASRTP